MYRKQKMNQWLIRPLQNGSSIKRVGTQRVLREKIELTMYIVLIVCMLFAPKLESNIRI